ncbi:hypothetical protein F5Y19DRAFT_482089 [Xylariaceae sp. FL1651]|nr:hypothetical protein F5Y19DRAFT_482089 [Xylariaceae sp. FL1651]
MSSTDQSYGSNNPFRRKPGISVRPAGAPSPSFGMDGPFNPPTIRPPFTALKSAMSEDHDWNREEQSVQQRPKKIVKKVRVQSPPPSSPEDSVPVTRSPASEHDDDDSASDSRESSKSTDPFNAESVDADENSDLEPPLPQIPPNPFARTLQDIEKSVNPQDADTTSTSASKGSLDVDSFKRLLLTGYANLPTPAPITADPGGNTSGVVNSLGALHDGASNTDVSSISKQSILDALQETPRTSHEISETEESEERKGILPASPLATVPSATARRKPPPPSSRHGKLIRIELGTDADPHDTKGLASPMKIGLPSPSIIPPRKPSSEATTPLYSPPATTDVNKPLPAPPSRVSAEEDVDSPFDREAAGKLPEASLEPQSNSRLPMSPPMTRSRSESQTSTQSRKPAAPPPRRHKRSDSKVPSVYPANTDEEPSRSSMESTRSRTDSLRINHAPAPPPPRRPTHNRQGSSYAGSSYGDFSPAMGLGVNEKERSPLGSGFTPTTSPGVLGDNAGGLSTVKTGPDGPSKISPPPPPPTRKQSTRRPPSVRSMEIGSTLGSVRRASREKDNGAAPPPPPPPRARVGGRSNLDASAVGVNGTRKTGGDSLSAESDFAVSPVVSGDKQGAEILADLDALQREVDAMMQKTASS